MSNTVITNFRDASGPRSSADSPFVVVLERDGTISLDNAALDGLVSGDGSQSSGISVVRVGQEGRPDDATDSETEDDSVPHVTLSVDGYYDDPNGIAKYDSGIEMLQSLSNETREHSLIGFQNDHCYTPLLSPSQTLPSHTGTEITYDELQQLSKPCIPSSKKITILEQQIIPKGKKIVFNPTKAPVILKGNDALSKPLPGLSAKPSKKATGASSPQANEKQEDPSKKCPSENTESSSSSTSGESINDRDSDADYSYARDHLSSKSKKTKTVLRGVKKVIAKNYGNVKVMSKSISKSKPTKSLIRQEIKDKILHKKSKLQLEKKAIAATLSKKQPGTPINAKEPAKIEQKVEPPKPQKVVKKEKKTPAHMNVLLSDMTTLFSTPDVIRRVSTDGKNVSKTEKSSNFPSKDAAPASSSEALTEAGASVDSKDKSASRQLAALKTYSKPKERVNLTEKMVKEMESIPQIDDASLAQLLQDTPPITTGTETATALGVATTTAANPLSSPNLGPLSPTLDLLAGLQPEEEGLTEDLLMHVAQLVESSENLQEVIDKQVLGKVDPVLSKPPTTPAPPIQTAQTFAQASASKLQQRASGPRKDPIQIVRSDGRVITLPPIEAPATRSSKRKSLGPAALEHEDPVPESPTVPALEPTLVQANPKQYSNKKLSMKKGENPQTNVAAGKLFQESDDSLNSEDDPYRLWCICKQPHNNRFMICCDRCEDWFHGKCVNITKAMGQQMEEQGVEWTCPNCIKKFQAPKSLHKPVVTRRSIEASKEAARGSTSNTPPAARKTWEAGAPSCIVCEKASRAGSIYCSDACILKHAQESLGTNSSAARSDATDKADSRVIVFERRTGRVLQGPNAPTADNLKAWLQEHPTFEVVRRERENKPMVNVKKTPAKPTQKIQTTLKFDKQQKQIILLQPQSKPPPGDSKQTKLVQPSLHDENPKTPIITKQRPSLQLKQTLLTPKEGPATPKQGFPTLKQSPTTPKQVTPTPKLPQPTPKTPEVKRTPVKVTPVRTPSTSERQQGLKSPSTPTTRRREREPEAKPKPTSTEPIRDNVRKALQEHMAQRLSETKAAKFTDEEIKKFAIETELEMHSLFKEVSIKYKAKYRSLIFNIKDRKNLSLWKKISDRTLTPKQLVRMSPEELASQELAQWRDKEAKYQLELIKKSELDLLAASKTYVLKTHKGEEVMEQQKPVAAELDPNVAVEDLVSALNDSVTGEEQLPSDNNDKFKHSRQKDELQKKSPPRETPTRSSSRHKSQKEEKKKGSHKKGKDDRERRAEERRSRRVRRRSRDRTRDRSKQKADKKESRSKSASKEIPSSSEQTKTRSRSSERSKHRSRSRVRSRTRRRSRSKSKRSRSKYRSQSRERPHRSLSQENDYHSKDKYSSKDSESVERPKSAMQKEIHPEYDPHEPMITSAFSEEDLRRSRETSFEEPYVDDALDAAGAATDGEEYDPADALTVDARPALAVASSGRADRIPSEAESDQEPSSTVDSSAPPVWNGLVNMVDVARFYVDAHQVSGNCADLEDELSPELDIVGRINPETVWDYISKMKRTGNKDILVMRLTSSAAATVEERMQYIALYSYLSSRNRLGVVKVTNSSVKDFYMFPLAASASLPPVLLPLDGPGLEDVRNHLLLAIIVRQRKKRHAATKADAIPAKMSKSGVRTRSYTPPVGGESYTPPASPARRSSALRLPLPFVPPTPALPSSVKDKIAASLASAEDEAYSPGSSSGSSVASAGPDSLRSRVDEINRQIEEQKQQILSMAAGVPPPDENEAYSPSRPMTPPRPALADIALPSNLQEILATIQQRSAPPPPPPADVDMRIPPPPPSGHLHALTEEQLLRMVPDN